MRVDFAYHAQVRQAAGLMSESMEFEEGIELVAAMLQLADRYGESFRSLVLDGTDKIRQGLLVTVNDQVLVQNEHCKLSEGDRIAILSPMAGG